MPPASRNNNRQYSRSARPDIPHFANVVFGHFFDGAVHRLPILCLCLQGIKRLLGAKPLRQRPVKKDLAGMAVHTEQRG